MLYPYLPFWNRARSDDASARIDRALHNRNHRLVIGLSTSPQFDQVRGAIVVSQGHGKYLRIRHMIGASEPVPETISAALRQFLHEGIFGDQSVGLPDLFATLQDLACPQAALVEKLKCQAGKYVDRVLAISVVDPGFWSTDFDGQLCYASICDPTRLAELSGVSVIDAFPGRDLAVGGNGNSLQALPYWLMFADRNKRTASHFRLVVDISDSMEAVWLPASDGLDAELPDIRSFWSVGPRFLIELLNRFEIPQSPGEINRLYAEGRLNTSLIESWNSMIGELGSQNCDPHIRVEKLLGCCELSQENQLTIADVTRSGLHWIVDLLMKQVQHLKITEARINCHSPFAASLINQFGQAFGVENPDAVGTIDDLGIASEFCGSAHAAMLGLLHIDQMPANVPSLTGATSLRILGRLTPGRPANWRQLIQHMADNRPAPMKLKDAV